MELGAYKIDGRSGYIGWASRNDSQTKMQNWLMRDAVATVGKVEKQEASLELVTSRTYNHGRDPKIRKLLAQLPLDTHVASD